jgi:uncharacterized membrane protein YbaN (DUF454 family)
LQLKTIVLTGLAFFFLVLGAIGLFLPVWPTTPFVLLSVACCSSVPQIRTRIMSIPFFREHIENYEQRKGLSQKTLWLSLGWLWGMMLLSIFLIRSGWVSLLLILIGLAVTIHLLWMAKGSNKDGLE